MVPRRHAGLGQRRLDQGHTMKDLVLSVLRNALGTPGISQPEVTAVRSPIFHTLPNKIVIFFSVMVGIFCTSARADSTAIAALVEALRQAAPQTNDPTLYTDWKMQAGAIASWTRRCVGVTVPPAELAENPVMARQTVTCVMGPVLAEQTRLAGGDEGLGVRRAAAWWMTGDPARYQAADIAAYLGRVLSHYWTLRNAP
jgi:hypothetical protein